MAEKQGKYYRYVVKGDSYLSELTEESISYVSYYKDDIESLLNVVAETTSNTFTTNEDNIWKQYTKEE